MDRRLRSALSPRPCPQHLSLSRSCDRQRRAGWCRPLASPCYARGRLYPKPAQALCRPAGRPAARVRTRRPAPVWHTHPSRLASDPACRAGCRFFSGQRRRCAPAHLAAGTGTSNIWRIAGNIRADGLNAGDSGEGPLFFWAILWTGFGLHRGRTLAPPLGRARATFPIRHWPASGQAH